MGLAGLFIAALAVAMIVGALGVIPATVDAPGIPRAIIVLILVPFVAVGLFVALAGVGALVGSRTIPRVAVWLGALGVLSFIGSMAVLLTWAAFVPAGTTRVWLLGAIVPLSATAATLVDRLVVGALALLVDLIAVGCGVVLIRGRRRARSRLR
jgi:hypothetical protein